MQVLLPTSGLDQGLEREVRSLTQFSHPKMPRLPFVGKRIYVPVKINTYVKTQGNSYLPTLSNIHKQTRTWHQNFVYREESLCVPMSLIITHKRRAVWPTPCFCIVTWAKMGFHILKDCKKTAKQYVTDHIRPTILKCLISGPLKKVYQPLN